MLSNYQPLISVIVPIYNRERTLDVCIKSILDSEYKNIELILVDDGSSDSSIEICQRYADVDDRIKLICQPNKGVSAARNVGIKKAKGEWITFVDSDDAIQSGFYKNIVDAFIDDVDLVMSGRCYGRFDGTSVRVLHKQKEFYTKRIIGRSEVIRFLFGEFNPYGNGFFLCTDKLFRRSLLSKYDICFREDMSLDEDQVFVLNYLKYVNSFYFDNFPYYLSLKWDNETRKYGLGTDLRTPEKYLSIYKANYDAFEELYAVCPDDGLKVYQVNYVLDRPLTRILYKYCLLGNIGKYGYRNLKRFTKEQILPLFKKETGNMGLLRNKTTEYFDKALFCQPFLGVYLQIVVLRNINYYFPGFKKLFKKLPFCGICYK